jgi:CRISPR-associated protein Csm3
VQKSGGKPCGCGGKDCPVCRVFGSANSGHGKEADGQKGPTRLIVRDAFLSGDDKEKFKAGKPIVEEKSENSINRITAVANPRPIERVVPGVAFDFEMVYRIIDTGDGGSTDKEYFQKVVLEGLKILKDDYLGGGGSRGNGRIGFQGLTIHDGENKDITGDYRQMIDDIMKVEA